MYKAKWRIFHRTLRKYNSSMRDQIDTDPHTLWNYMKKLGPKRQNNV